MKQDWPSTVAKVIREAGIHPHDLEFEIIETSLLNNTKMVKTTIDSLRELGIKIALDDFGQGYSSLSYLTKFAFDVIKIDKSFIRNHAPKRSRLIYRKIDYLFGKRITNKSGRRRRGDDSAIKNTKKRTM